MRAPTDIVEGNFTHYTDLLVALGLMGMPQSLGVANMIAVPPRWGTAFPRLITEQPARFQHFLLAPSHEALALLAAKERTQALRVYSSVDQCNAHFQINLEGIPAHYIPDADPDTQWTFYCFVNDKPYLRSYPVDLAKPLTVNVNAGPIHLLTHHVRVVTGVVDEGGDAGAPLSSGDMEIEVPCGNCRCPKREYHEPTPTPAPPLPSPDPRARTCANDLCPEQQQRLEKLEADITELQEIFTELSATMPPR
mmetsp:Transcript_43754/g.102920  ORF Transcript_43754/g.102920 Transcript_43754/m.102920 type:complete len:251 (+) Transcript_43754:189-941(+)